MRCLSTITIAMAIQHGYFIEEGRQGSKLSDQTSSSHSPMPCLRPNTTISFWYYLHKHVLHMMYSHRAEERESRVRDLN